MAKNNAFRYKANALFFTIVISLVIALLCSSLIFIAYYHRLQVQNNQLRVSLIRNVNSGIQLLLTSSSSDSSTQTMDLFGNGQDTIRLRRAQWGLFEVGHVTAFSHGDEVGRSFMLGTIPDSIWNGALYMVDQGRPLSLSGNTLIRGTAYLPSDGIQNGHVETKNLEREKPVEGEIKNSTSRLPKLNETFLKVLLKQVDYRPQSQFFSEKALNADSLVVSFTEGTVRIHSKGRPLELSRICLKGNIIVSSDTLIIVSSSAKLENIILTAPKIFFKDDFEGRVQAFATDTLITGESCYFKYPSSLTMLEIDSIDNRPKVVLSKKSTLEGVMLQYISFLTNNFAIMSVHKEAKVIGQIFADGYLSMRGTTFGTVVCANFYLNLPSGTYKSNLLDCTMDRKALSPFYLGTPLFGGKRKGVAQWLE